MPLKTLVVIALRLYAIYFLVQGISSLVAYLPLMLEFDRKIESSTGLSSFTGLSGFGIVIAVNILFAVILWALASILSACVTKGHDTELAFTSLTKEDLYRFAFVFLGLFFVVSSLSGLIQTGHKFFAYGLPLSENDPQRSQYLWPLLGNGVTTGTGLACMLGARRWTTKLIRWEEKNAAPPSA